MKRILLIAVLLSAFIIELDAQKVISDATFKYSIVIRKTDQDKKSNPLSKASYQLYIKGNQTRSDFVNNLGTETSYYNSKTEKGVILKEYSGQKLMINLTQNDWLIHNKVFKNLEFNFIKDEKQINETVCKTAIANLSEGEKLIVYYDPSVTIANNNYTIAFPSIPGLPIQFEKQSNGLSYIYTLESFSYEIVAATIFELPKSGYRVISYQDAIALKKNN